MKPSGLEDMAEENASTAGRKETASEEEEEEEEEEEVSAADKFGYFGLISVLFETPSGFAIFGYDAFKLTERDAWKHIWADFVGVPKAVVWLSGFQTFENKGDAINRYTVSPELRKMILEHVVKGQTLAVENKEYKNIIEDVLQIPCITGKHVNELMWGLKIQMKRYLPPEIAAVTNEDRFPMSKGMRFLLNYHKYEVNLDMMVTKRMIEMAAVVYECDCCVKEREYDLRLAAEHLKEISQIDDADGWDLLKLATALMIICKPKNKIPAAEQLFPEQVLKTLIKDAPKYKNKIYKKPCSEVYREIYSARKSRLSAAKVLFPLVKQAKKEYEDEQARISGKIYSASDDEIGPAWKKRISGKIYSASDDEIGPARKKLCCGFDPSVTFELDKWFKTYQDKLFGILLGDQKDPRFVDSVREIMSYTEMSTHPLNMKNIPGILSMDIHPSKAIVATGGFDANAVLFDCKSNQILCTLTAHLKKITSLKFVNESGLFITGSADKTVRIWQGSEDGNYSCIHTLKDHTAEVEAVTVHPSQKYFVSTSRNNSWRFYDVSTASCLGKFGESSGQEGYTSAAFHPSGVTLGTGTTNGGLILWDVRNQTKTGIIDEHAGGITAVSFAADYLATAASNGGVSIWDTRFTQHPVFPLLHSRPSYLSTPINAVEFDSSGIYLAIGDSDLSVYKLCGGIRSARTCTDSSVTGKVTSVKFGAGASYIAVGSTDENLRIFADARYFPMVSTSLLV